MVMLSTDLPLTGFRADYEALKAVPAGPQWAAGHGAGANWHFRSESQYLRLMELARDVIRNDMVLAERLSRRP